MRLARVAVDDAARPVLALERDGALYDVGELELALGVRSALHGQTGNADFHTRVSALAGAGLAELDRRLAAGDRPSSARIKPGTFSWLPPCDPDRAALFELAPGEGDAPSGFYRLHHARGLLGHGSLVPVHDGAPSAQLSLAVVLGDALDNASPAEAEAAIFGATILNVWRQSAPLERPGWTSRRTPVQLGPSLVTIDDITDASGVARLRAQVRVASRVVRAMDVIVIRSTLAASIAWLSGSVELRAGDVVGVGAIPEGCVSVPLSEAVELVVERLGKLGGTALAST